MIFRSQTFALDATGENGSEGLSPASDNFAEGASVVLLSS